MKIPKWLSMFKDITMDVWYEVVYFVQMNMRYAAALAEIVLPYGMYVLGQSVALSRGSIEVGGEIFIPILCTVVIHYIKEFANKSGKGNTIPIPAKRFTEVDDDGEVSVDNKRLQELLLYVADLEDYMTRKRWL